MKHEWGASPRLLQAYEGRGSSKSSLPEISLYIPTERHQQPSRGAVTELQDSLSSSLLSHSRTYSPSSTSLVGLAPAEWDEELDVASGSRDTSLSNAHHDAVSGGGGPKRDEDWSTKRSLYNICFEPDDFQQSTSE